MSAVTIELLTKPGCHLCEAARQTTGQVAAQFGLSFTERNIQEDPDLMERYRNEIPVLLVDGEVKDFWQVNAKRLTKILARKTGQTN